MSTDQIIALLLLASNVAGAIGFGVWFANWGAGLVAFAILTILMRFANK